MQKKSHHPGEFNNCAQGGAVGRLQRAYDKHLYKLRHLVENAFLHLKRWRGIATRYAKNLKSFVAAVQIRCLMMWLKIS